VARGERRKQSIKKIAVMTIGDNIYKTKLLLFPRATRYSLRVTVSDFIKDLQLALNHILVIETQQGCQLSRQGVFEFIECAVGINDPPDSLHDIGFFLTVEMGIDFSGKLKKVGALLTVLV
jgi:hypothetical protein